MIHSLTDIKAVADYLRRIGAEVRSLKTAVVKQTHGKYWKDIAIITITKEGKVIAPDEYGPTEQEAVLIEQQCASVEWPTIKKVKRLPKLPKDLAKVPADQIYEFRDLNGDLLMIQWRMPKPKEADKAYIPYTYWSDNEWRKMEPEGQLPLWGLDRIGDNTTVFIHEGAKAARAVSDMIIAETNEMKEKKKAHPWGDELSGAAHVGWIGGALSPARTDWNVLIKAGIKRAYIVSDNDQPGLMAVPSISYKLPVPTFHVQFTNEWPGSFDLADDFPEKMFSTLGKKRYYIGPTFRSCLHPATWATDVKPNPSGKGRPTYVLRDNFKSMWAYVEEADLFVCTEMPEILRSEAVMNKMLSGFSHTNLTSNLMVKAYQGRSAKLCYRPDIKGKIVTDKTTSAINLHTPTHIKATDGDPQPFLDFLTYMFPNEAERHEVMRWCATLIAHPEIRMHYGMLLVSETQGIGKTTLGSHILAPLVGEQNASFPNEDDIVNSNFNGWLASKRLIVIAEIYSGHSWKAYNKLKGYITDRDVQVNEKYERSYRVENWAHIFASSNSRRALRMEDDDRRWFYPEIVERQWPQVKFATLNSWLQSGGLGIIKRWAEQFGDYVKTGDRAPMTERKRELIAGSRSDGQQEAVALAETIIEGGIDVSLPMKDIELWVRASVQGRMFDTDYELRKAMKEIGMTAYKKRIKIAGRVQYVLVSPVLEERIKGMEEAEQIAEIRKAAKKPDQVMGSTM